MDENNDTRTLVNSEINEDISPVQNVTQIPGIFERCCKFIKNITLEPCIFLFFIAISMEGTLFSEIILEKTCLIHFNYSISVCANITDHNEEQIIVQQEANRLLMIYNIVKCLPTILFVLFLGPWSDKHGRKIPLVLPFVGSAVSAAIMYLNTTIWDLPAEYILIAAIPISLTGGMTCLIMSMYSYISDISELRSRTARIAFFDTFLFLGSTFGLLLSNVTKVTVGFNGTYIIIGSLHVLSILYIAFRIEETRGENAQRDLDGELAPKSGSRLGDLFNCNNIRQTFTTTFEKRPNFGRAKILLLMTAICLMVFVFNGMGKEYFYTKLKFRWSYDDFIYWFVASIMIAFLGLTFIFPVLSFKFGIRDEFLGLLGCTSAVIHYLVMAFSSKGYDMYIASALGILSGVPLAVARSIISKLVPRNVTGKVFSVLASWESLLPLAAAPIYTLTYNSTVDIFPGTFLVVSSTAYCLSGIIFGVIYFLNRRGNVGLVVEIEE